MSLMIIYLCLHEPLIYHQAIERVLCRKRLSTVAPRNILFHPQLELDVLFVGRQSLHLILSLLQLLIIGPNSNLIQKIVLRVGE